VTHARSNVVLWELGRLMFNAAAFAGHAMVALPSFESGFDAGYFYDAMALVALVAANLAYSGVYAFECLLRRLQSEANTAEVWRAATLLVATVIGAAAGWDLACAQLGPAIF
jgi:hypothetical protein